jgi:hypothetical protein
MAGKRKSGTPLAQLSEKCDLQGKMNAGGEGGIRTPGTGFSQYNGLANRRLKPLGHLSGVLGFNRLAQVYASVAVLLRRASVESHV